MEEMKKTLQYWKKQEASVTSMYRIIKGLAQYLDEYEKSEIISYFPNLQGKNVLDLASGIGRFTKHFSLNANHLTSVDFADHFVEKNRLDHVDCPNVTYICSDALNLQMEENSLDFVFLNWLLMFLEDDETEILMNRIYKWLKPGGELFFRESCAIIRSKGGTNGYYAHYRPLSFYDGLVAKKFTLIKEGHINTYLLNFADPLQCYWHSKKPLSTCKNIENGYTRHNRVQIN